MSNINKKTKKTNKSKNVILMNNIALLGHIYDDTEITRLKVGTWSKEKQKKFLDSLYKFEDKTDSYCLCCFDVEYDNTRLCIIGIDDGVDYTDNNWDTVLKDAQEGEFTIIMYPFIKRNDVDDIKQDKFYCKCGATKNSQCPINIQNGKCTSPSIQKLIGEVLFPDKYSKTR